MNLCKYKNIFGQPNQGIHQYRFCHLAIVDVIMNVVGSWVLSLIFSFSFWKTLLFLFLLGIFCHWLFCVETTIQVLLFGKNKK